MIVSRTGLLDALRAVRPGVDKNSSNIQGMDCYIFLDGRVHAHDDAVSLSTPTQLLGDFAVSAVEFFGIVSKLKTPEIDVEVGDSALHIQCGKSKVTVSYKADEVTKRIKQITPKDSEWKGLTPSFSTALGLCAIHGMDQAVSAKLGGIFIIGDRMTATDNGSCIQCTIDQEMERIWLGTRAVSLLEGRKLERYCVRNGWVFFDSEGVRIACRKLIDDKYPLVKLESYLEEFHSDDAITGEFLKEHSKVIERAMVFAKNHEDGSVISLTFENYNLIVRSGTGAGSFEEEITMDIQVDKAFTVHVNAQRLKQVLGKHDHVPFSLMAGEEPSSLRFSMPGYVEALGLYKE